MTIKKHDTPKAGPSGATDKTTERESKFDEEGGAQPQAESEGIADKLLHPDQSQGPNEPLDSSGRK